MFEQLFEGLRKVSESSMVAQQEMFKQWIQHWPSTPLGTAQKTTEGSAFQKRWIESVTETLTKQRELLDSAYRTGIQVTEQAAQLPEVKSTEEYRRLAEDISRKLFELMRSQTEAQVQQLMKAAQTLLGAAQARQGSAPHAPPSAQP